MLLVPQLPPLGDSDVEAGNTKVALVINDLVSVDPWSPRYRRFYGTAELVDRPGRVGPTPYLAPHPTTSWSWNLDGPGFTHDREVAARRTVNEPARAENEEPTSKWAQHDRDHRRNRKTIAEFRANEGRVGGPFEGAPMVLVHHRGRKNERRDVTPMMYLPQRPRRQRDLRVRDQGGRPVRTPTGTTTSPPPARARVERGTETYDVTVRELTGAERDRDLRTSRPGATPASPSTSGKSLESAPSPCSNSRAA